MKSMIMKSHRVKHDAYDEGEEWIYGFNMYAGEFLQHSKSGGLYLYDHVDKSTLGLYTGLKDCNGVDIYEGDILGIKSGWTDRVYKHLVATIPDTNILTLLPAQFNPEYDQYSAFPIGWFNERQDRLFVVGNIHDNPELLHN